MKSKFIIASVVVFALLALGIGGTVAFAQGPAGGSTFDNLYLQTLAQKLGTTVDKLQQAMTDARKDAATQGVKQGILTQNEADRILGNTARGTIEQAEVDAAAKALGMTSADLQTALKTKTLLTIAQEKNVDVTKLRTAIADAEKAAIDQAVKNGTMTQAQADTLKANIKPENIDLNGHGLGGMRGGGLDQFGGMPGGSPDQMGGRGGKGQDMGGQSGKR